LLLQSAVDIAHEAGHKQIAAIIESDPYAVHIHDMSEQGKLLHVIALLKQGCPANYRDERLGLHGQTPLMAAALGGRVEVVRMLLRLPLAMSSIDDQDALGRTALMRAASVGALDVTAVLLNAGCDRLLKCSKGLTAYDYASRHSYTVMFKYSAQSMIR
jgi:ankyrin repeat protein